VLLATRAYSQSSCSRHTLCPVFEGHTCVFQWKFSITLSLPTRGNRREKLTYQHSMDARLRSPNGSAAVHVHADRQRASRP
jgi:hypothetical protein